MEEYVLSSIKENKIKNAVNSLLLIHEYHEYEYENKKYVNFYIYSEKNVTSLKINNLEPIYSRYIQGYPNVICATYLSEQVMPNFYITEYTIEGNVYKVDNNKLIDYNDYDLNKNNLTILRKLKPISFPIITVLPVMKDDYWICACGKANTGDTCHKCGAKLDYANNYNSEEKIHKAYAKVLFNKVIFSSEDEKSEIEKFKQKIQKDGINPTYLDDKFFNEVNDTINNKVVEHKRAAKNLNIFVITLVIFILAFIAISIANKIRKENEAHKNMTYKISQYCELTSYSKEKEFSNILQDSDCGSFIYYLDQNIITNEELMSIIEKNDEKFYKTYYDYTKQNVHETLANDAITNKTYLGYLYEQKMNINDKLLSNILTLAVKSNDLDLFKKFAGLVTDRKSFFWEDSYNFFNYDEYDGYNENMGKLSDFALVYHQEKGDSYCYEADLESKENLQYLFTNFDNKVCQSKLQHLIPKSNSSIITIYYNSGGDFNYYDYDEGKNYIYFMADSYTNYFNSPNEISPEDFKTKIVLLKKYGVKINEQLKSPSYQKGITPLDKFIYDKYQICQSPYSYSKGVEYCDKYKELYRVLKNNGAVCNKECYNERYFK